MGRAPSSVSTTITAAGTQVSGLWCEDWVGLRHTSFGARLFWDWKANEERYPGLRETRSPNLPIAASAFSATSIPYLAVDSSLFAGCARRRLFLARNDEGGTALVDFGEFDCGVVDFTNPDASGLVRRARDRAEHDLDYGLSGWMADFGEYLPIDVHLANGVDANADAQCLADPVGRGECPRRREPGQDRRGPVLHARRLHRSPEALPACSGPAINRSTSLAMMAS